MRENRVYSISPNIKFSQLLEQLVRQLLAQTGKEDRSKGSDCIECFQTMQDSHFIYLVLIIHWTAGEENKDHRDLQNPNHFSFCSGIYVLSKMKNIKECMPAFQVASWLFFLRTYHANTEKKQPHIANWAQSLSCWAKRLSTEILCYIFTQQLQFWVSQLKLLGNHVGHYAERQGEASGLLDRVGQGKGLGLPPHPGG